MLNPFVPGDAVIYNEKRILDKKVILFCVNIKSRRKNFSKNFKC